jgi:hypothetical protein
MVGVMLTFCRFNLNKIILPSFIEYRNFSVAPMDGIINLYIFINAHWRLTKEVEE